MIFIEILFFVLIFHFIHKMRKSANRGDIALVLSNLAQAVFSAFIFSCLW
jgi:riboflavin transporter FmnP